jgi:SPOR domain
MSAIFRHMTVRLWITALAGGLVCMVLAPEWQRFMGLSGLWIPMVAGLTGCFALCGWVMNRLGLAFIRRQIAEAAVWERAGMYVEAEGAFERAKALYDGFWLSPLQRRRNADWIMLRLARFCIAQPSMGRAARATVSAYLELHPEDEAVALGWLERALQQDVHTRNEHEAAARINEALQDSEKVQRLLMQFYLSNGRSDFEAVQTYRRVWQWTEELPDAMVRKVARLLVNETCLNDWALQVYLKGYASGDTRCLEGLAAAVRWMRPGPGNRDDLAQAERIVAGLDEAQRTKLFQTFEPLETFAEDDTERNTFAEDDIAEVRRPYRSKTLGLRRHITVLWQGLVSFYQQICAIKQHFGTSNRIRRLFPSARLNRIAACGAAVCVLTILIVVGWRMVGRKPLQHPPVPEPQAPAVSAPTIDPFTIQVAAYLKAEDAQAYVDRLKQQKIDAFWTKATSGQRTWYQVKVSHFASKDAARKYGETLKTQGMIDDFYVANYTQ